MPNGFGGGGADFGDIGDIFESIFGSAFGGRQQQRGPARGADLRYDMEIRLEDAFAGCTREIEVDVAARCDACDGSGARPGTQTHRCTTCGGMGKVRAQQGFFMVERTRSEEHTSELQSLMRISYAVFCLKKKTHYNKK